MAIDLSALSAREALTAIYIGYYDRAADAEGIAFWEGVVANTSLDLVAITSDFASQAETQSVHPFFMDPATNSPATFVTSLFQNLFNRDPDAAGLEFWSNALQDAVDGVEGAITVGEIITAIIEGAVDTPADPEVEGSVATNDRTVILNKIEVGLDWTTDSEEAGIDYATNTAAQASAAAIIEGVTDDPATVTAAKSTTDDFFADDGGDGGTVIDGETQLLTSATDDVLTGTDDNDLFNGYIAQNPFAGGVSNTLSSADRLDGGAGTDRLYAEITGEFVGIDGDDTIDVQPRLTAIEEIDLEARDGSGVPGTVTVDAKNITGHDEIGSYYSDGDLVIENLTTLTDAGTIRNTSEITVTMDHTDNFNSDGDASDLDVLFDNDYLVSGQETQGQIFYFILDEDAELAGLDDRLDNIDVDGIRFNITINGVVTAVNLEADEANEAGTHEGFVAALQAPLQALIDDGTLPAGTTLTLDPTITETTFIDDGSESDPIPAIVLTSGDGSVVEATGFSRVAEPIGEYDVFGRFNSVNEVAEQPISVDVDLHKAGRGGEGGDLVIGGKSENAADDTIADGIEVINLNVLGAGDEDATPTKPSNVGTITSTGDELTTVNITTDAAFAAGTSYASLTVRNGFDEDTIGSTESGDLQLVNANGFLGDLVLGDIDAANNAGRITNLDTLTAVGGGDVEFNALLNGTETDQAYSYTTGAGDDIVSVVVDGDALDFANSSLTVNTGAGDDSIDIDGQGFSDADLNNNTLNQAILDNVDLLAGAGDDVIDVDNVYSSNIEAGSGDDVVYTDGVAAVLPTNAIWAVNVDGIRATAQGLAANGPEDLPGVQTSLAYLSGATVTVTLSGAGIAAAADGGGIMALAALGAVAGDDGYEASFTISSLINGNEHYGDQRDINAAVIRAIEDDPVLSSLLTVVEGANNTLAIVSTTSGNFDASDLRIEVAQDATAGVFTSVQDEARTLFSNSGLAVASVADANTAAGNDLATTAGADAYYDGLSASGDAANGMNTGALASNLHTAGTASTAESDGTIDGGAGDDVIVLSTDAVIAVTPVATSSSNNDLINGASNETVVMTGTIGDDTIMNFTSGPDIGAPGDGIDFLDFTSYLDSQESASGSTASAVNIDVTLAVDITGVTANEVAVIDFDDVPTTDTFDGLGATQVAALFNGGATYGTLPNGTVVNNAAATTIVGGDASAILMIQNTDNDGEYKVFELEWDASLATTPTVAVTDLGSLDFGDTLDTLDEANLIGSAAQAAIDFSV